MKDKTTPRYLITVESFYTDVFGLEHFISRSFHIEIMHVTFPDIKLSDKVYFTEDPSIDFSLPQSAVNSRNSSNEMEPEIFVIGKSNDGKIRLGWSVPMK